MSTPRRLPLALLAVAVLLAAACGSDADDDGGGATATPDTTTAPGDTGSPDTTTAPDTTPPDTTTAPDTTGTAAGMVDDLRITAIDIAAGTVTLTNTGDGDVDIGGTQLCNRPNYVEIGAETLAPGQSTTQTLVAFDAAGGEAALYSSSDFGSADAMIDYVQWGGGGGRAQVAADAGLWAGDPIPADAVGEVLTLTGDPGSAAGWS